MSPLPEPSQTTVSKPRPGSTVIENPLEQRQCHSIDTLHPHMSTASCAVSVRATETAITQVPETLWKRVCSLNPFRTSYFSLYRPLTTWRERGILVLAVALSLAAGVPLPIIGVIFGKIINDFPPAQDELNFRIGQLLGTAVVYFFITWGWAICWGKVGERISRGLREQLLKKALGMDMAWFEVECPDIAQRLTADTQTIQLGTSEKCGLFLQSIAYFIAAFTTGFIINPHLTGIMFAGVVPPMFLVMSFGSRIVLKYARQASEFSEKATSVVGGAVNSVQVVQAFGVVGRLADEQMGYMNLAVKQGIKRSVAGAIMLGLVYFIAYAANALAFWQGSQQIANGAFHGSEGAGTVYTIVFLILDAAFVIGSFGPFLQTFALAAASGKNILDLLDRPQPVINVYSEGGCDIPLPAERNDIVFHNVTFAYPARPTARVVNNINLTIPAGKVTAIVGSSGSGKSTLTSMVLRFYDPASGRITVGGRELQQLNVHKYRQHIGLVDQEPVLFAGTLMDNIKHGLLHCAGLNEEEQYARCIQAARDASAYDFITKFPDGFNTVIEGGSSTQLSGGQKQRVAIARALVSDPNILILDEPTAALDNNSEAIIMKALDRAQEVLGRTTLVIAHRLSTIKNSHKIVVMSHGRIEEEGTHDELMERKCAYYRLAKAQELQHGSSASSLGSTKTRVDEVGLVFETVKGDLSNDKEKASSGIERHEDEGKQIFYSSCTLLRRCLALSKPDAPIIALGLLASLVTGGLVLGESIIFGNLVIVLNQQRDSERSRSDANFYSLIFFVLSLFALCAYAVSGSAFGIVSERLIRRIRDISLRTMMRQDVSWFHQPGHSSSMLIGTLSMDAGHLSGLSGIILGTICSIVTSMTGGIILAHVVAWKIAIVLLAAVPVMLVSGFLRLRVLAKFEQRHETAYLGAAALATEACRSIRTISSLGRERDVVSLYAQAVKKPYQESLRFITVGNFWLAFALSITYFVYALAYYWGSCQVRDGNYTSRDFFIVLPALLFSAQASGQMFSLAPEVTRAKTAARSIFTLHDQIPTIDTDDDASHVPPTLSQNEKLPASKLQLRDLYFHYPSRPAPVLRGISLTIEPGSFVAFVGASGAGKSSVISLIERFSDPTSGAVLLDDVDIRTLPVGQHRARIALVAQESCLFPGSMSFNVSLGAVPGTTVPQADVERVCKMVGLDEFVMSLPEGYNTEVGPNGSQISGGQRQRIALARALIRDPQVLLLDEATPALDSTSEKLVQSRIAAAARGRTCITIAHRLASIVMADCIYVFENGTIVEKGRHEELLAIVGGRYAEMARQQMS